MTSARARAPAAQDVAVGDLAVGPAVGGWVISHSGASAGLSRIGGASKRSATCGGLVDVVVVGVGAHDSDDAAAGDTLGDLLQVVRGVDDDDLVVVADDPHVVVDVPGASVEGERSGGDDVVDRSGGGSSEDHDRAEDLAAFHAVEGFLDGVEADLLGHELVQGGAGPAGRGR